MQIRRNSCPARTVDKIDNDHRAEEIHISDIAECGPSEVTSKGTVPRRRASITTYLKYGARRSSLSSSINSDGIQEEGNDVTGMLVQPEKRALRKTVRAVKWIRISVCTSLLIATATVATLVFYYISHNEHSEFLNDYDDVVVKVADGFQHSLDNLVFAASALSAMYTGRYGDEYIWPNVTLSHFQEQATGLLRLSQGRAISFNPIINNKTRQGWEAYASATASLQQSESLLERKDNTSRIVSDGIFRVLKDAEGNRVRIDDPGISRESTHPRVLVPVWQIAPIEGNEAAVMFNLHAETNRQRALDDLLTYKVPTLTAILQLVQDTETRPSSIFFYPVLSSFTNNQTTQDAIVGSISIVFAWDAMLGQILPDFYGGIVCVLKSSIDQQFTFSMEGNKVSLLGEGDLHDQDFEDMVYKVMGNLKGTSHKEVEYLVDYELFIYPSIDFESKYKTSSPWKFTIVTLFIFSGTAGLFLLYDWLVSRRQEMISKAAARSGNIVASMYPAQVRDRLLFRHTEQNTDQKGKKGISLSKLARTKVEDPIADLYEETSIMFCDLVGFTEWSSSHTPNQVFQLLETIFWEFDQLADRLGVFKLGTIGDCYIAVTGIPDPMPNHASILAKFTAQCRGKIKEIENRLQGSDLDVSKIQMRFGIHSGPVTAGILRGQKPRFELFGDTINTASRMESTSLVGGIQLSEETAMRLRAEGLESWLVPRLDKVEAKGKGKMSTYWLQPPIHTMRSDE